jgi:DME family drug/metabolite transporter
MQTNPKLGVAMVLAAAVLWGTTGTAQTFVVSGLSAGWFGALRLVVASVFFAVYATGAGRWRHDCTPHARLSRGGVIGAGLCMAVYNLAFFAGIRHTGIAVGTAVTLGSAPLWAGVLQSLVTRRVPASAWWAGTGVGVGGGVLMTSANRHGSAEISAVGILLCLLSGLAYAGYTLISKELVRNAFAVSVTLRTFAVAAMIAVPAAWLDSGRPAGHAADAWAIAYVGIVTAGVSYLLFSHALRHISAATGVTLALGEPVMAFALAVLVVGERPSAAAFGGLFLVLGSVLVVVRAELRSAAGSLPITSADSSLRTCQSVTLTRECSEELRPGQKAEAR